MSKRFKKVSIGLGVLVLPILVSAQTAFSVLERIEQLFGMLIPLIITIALVLFLVGIIKYVTAKGAEDHAGAIKTIVIGIIVLFVMVSVWGLVRLFGETIGIQPGDNTINTNLVPNN